MKEMLPVIGALITLITPNPEMKGIRLKKKELKLAKKQLRIAEKMYKAIEKEFKKDGLDPEEVKKLEELSALVMNRRIDLM